MQQPRIMGRVDSSWAKDLTEHAELLKRFNGTRAESLLRRVELPMLGGLMLRFFDNVVNRNNLLMHEAEGQKVVDLAFGETALLTTAETIIDGLVEDLAGDTVLVAQLQHRLRDPQIDDELWALPLRYVDLTENTTLAPLTSAKLPSPIQLSA